MGSEGAVGPVVMTVGGEMQPIGMRLSKAAKQLLVAFHGSEIGILSNPRRARHVHLGMRAPTIYSLLCCLLALHCGGSPRMHQTVELDDSPVIRGMLEEVRHLVVIDEA